MKEKNGNKQIEWIKKTYVWMPNELNDSVNEFLNELLWYRWRLYIKDID